MLCANCGEPLKCTCNHPVQPIGQTSMGCPKLTKGRLWIHVTDDLGIDIPGVPVIGTSEKPTESNGLAKFEELDPATYTAVLKPTPKNLEVYDVPKDARLSRPVLVKGGILAYVMFDLIRKAELKVRLTLKSGVNLAKELQFNDVLVKATYTGDGAQPIQNESRSAAGVANFGRVSAGKYKLTLSGLSKNDYDYEDPADDVELTPGNPKEEPIEVRRKSALKVEIYCEIIEGRRELFTGLEVEVTTACGLNMKTKTGIADFGKVTTKSYEVTIAFVAKDQNVFDLRQRVTDTIHLDPENPAKLEFDVDPLYRKVHFVAHCLLTIPRPYYVAGGAGGNWYSRYNGANFATDRNDIDARVALMRAAAEAAEAIITKRHDEIKVMIMPECYFIGKNGAYQQVNLAYLTDKLLELTSVAKWKHWVFICGTVNTYVTLTEMYNRCAAIRGGGADQPTYSKFIQKYYYSAEIPELSELEVAPVNGLPLTKESVGADFGPVQKETSLANLLTALASNAEPLITGKAVSQVFIDEGLTALHWTNLKVLLQGQLNVLGALGLARKIAKYPDFANKQLRELEYCSVADAETTNPTVATYSWERIAAGLVRLNFQQRITAKASDIEAAKYVQKVLAACDAPPPGVQGLNFQVGTLKVKVGEVLNAVQNPAVGTEGKDSDAFQELITADAVQKHLDSIPIIKKLISLEHPAFVKPKQSEDYPLDSIAFQCERKPGPMKPLGTLPEDRVITFAVETCADHSQQRLKYATGQKPPVDIHLVPSAGMILNTRFLDARVGGFAVNCDGWNAVSSLWQTVQRQNRTVHAITVDNGPVLESGKNPLKPHSEVMKIETKAGGDSTTTTVPLAQAAVDAPGDASQIFGDGAGKLHIYAAQDLPNVKPGP